MKPRRAVARPLGAILLAPAFQRLGLTPLAAHMFIFANQWSRRPALLEEKAA